MSVGTVQSQGQSELAGAASSSGASVREIAKQAVCPITPGNLFSPAKAPEVARSDCLKPIALPASELIPAWQLIHGSHAKSEAGVKSKPPAGEKSKPQAGAKSKSPADAKPSPADAKSGSQLDVKSCSNDAVYRAHEKECNEIASKDIAAQDAAFEKHRYLYGRPDSPFQPGRSSKYPANGGGLGKPVKPSTPTRSAAVAHRHAMQPGSARPKPATASARRRGLLDI